MPCRGCGCGCGCVMMMPPPPPPPMPCFVVSPHARPVFRDDFLRMSHHPIPIPPSSRAELDEARQLLSEKTTLLARCACVHGLVTCAAASLPPSLSVRAHMACAHTPRRACTHPPPKRTGPPNHPPTHPHMCVYVCTYA